MQCPVFYRDASRHVQTYLSLCSQRRAHSCCSCVQGRVVALQALSGTGSLRVGAAFIAKFLPGTKVYLSNPTWGNHNNIFADAGVPAEKYRCCASRPTLSLLTAGELRRCEGPAVRRGFHFGFTLPGEGHTTVYMQLCHMNAPGRGT